MPVRKTVIAVRNACRVVTRCRNQPVTGMTTAIVSMKAVESHCALRAVTSSSTISRGIALTMIVSLRITTKVASTSQRSTAYGDSTGVAAAVRACSGVGVGVGHAEVLGVVVGGDAHAGVDRREGENSSDHAGIPAGDRFCGRTVGGFRPHGRPVRGRMRTSVSECGRRGLVRWVQSGAVWCAAGVSALLSATVVPSSFGLAVSDAATPPQDVVPGLVIEKAPKPKPEPEPSETRWPTPSRRRRRQAASTGSPLLPSRPRWTCGWCTPTS